MTRTSAARLDDMSWWFWKALRTNYRRHTSRLSIVSTRSFQLGSERPIAAGLAPDFSD
jgi:hypothetical protein